MTALLLLPPLLRLYLPRLLVDLWQSLLRAEMRTVKWRHVVLVWLRLIPLNAAQNLPWATCGSQRLGAVSSDRVSVVVLDDIVRRGMLALESHDLTRGQIALARGGRNSHLQLGGSQLAGLHSGKRLLQFMHCRPTSALLCAARLRQTDERSGGRAAKRHGGTAASQQQASSKALG